jgi:uncharacterized protein (DUF305 family)
VAAEAHVHDHAQMGAGATSTSAPMASAGRDTAAERRRGFTEADVRFMQHMIAHHAQAVAMTALVEARTTRADLRLVAQRIALSQNDEMALMRRWLQDRGQSVPAASDAHDHMSMAGGEHALMPGMLTPQEIAALEASTGAEFERRFLEGMIRHHEGALVMVSELFATPGAAQQSEVYQFATDVNADQQAEIARMRAVLGRGGSPP